MATTTCTRPPKRKHNREQNFRDAQAELIAADLKRVTVMDKYYMTKLKNLEKKEDLEIKILELQKQKLEIEIAQMTK